MVHTVCNMRFFDAKNRISNNGFTLVELVIVIAIIGIISATMISLLNPNAQLAKGRNAQRNADVTSIQSALEEFRSQDNGYPGTVFPCGGKITDGTTTFMNVIPCDPINSNGLVYQYVPINGKAGSSAYYQGYCLQMCLENQAGANQRCPQAPSLGALQLCPGGSQQIVVTNP